MKQIRDDDVKSKIGPIELLKRMWPYVRNQKTLLAATLLSVLIQAGLGRSLPFVIGYAVDEGMQKKSLEIALYAAGLYLILEILKGAALFIYRYLFQKLGNRVLYNVRDHLIEHVQALPMDYFNTQPTGRIVTRVTNDVHALGELFTGGVVMLFAEGVTLLSILIAMLFISVELTLTVMVIVPLFVIVAIKLSQLVRRILRAVKAKLAAINAFTAENLNGINVIQLYNRVDVNRQRFDKLSDDYKGLNLKAVHSYAMLWPTMSLFNAATIGLALYAGSLNDTLAIGSLIAFFMLTQDFLHPLRNILERYIQFQNSLTSGERIFTLFDELEEDHLEDKVLRDKKLKGQIEFRELSFRYQPHLPFALNGIDLNIQPGESIAIVGRTGSGKSTIISLLQRFYDYDIGQILLDGQPLNSYPRRYIRNQVGVVQQDGFTFRGTLLENITLNNEDIRREDVEEACRKVGLDRTIQRFENGLMGMIEERGNNLSVGERQLIAFARVLAFDKDLLILDEATANIDSQSEMLIQKATEEVTKNRTSIIIAHRLSTIRNCDRIVVLRDGQIIEMGSHEELIERSGGIYRSMYRAQIQ